MVMLACCILECDRFVVDVPSHDVSHRACAVLTRWTGQLGQLNQSKQAYAQLRRSAAECCAPRCLMQVGLGGCARSSQECPLARRSVQISSYIASRHSIQSNTRRYADEVVRVRTQRSRPAQSWPLPFAPSRASPCSPGRLRRGTVAGLSWRESASDKGGGQVACSSNRQSRYRRMHPAAD